MTVMFFNLVGGIGLFLLGMVLLIDGLKSLAGDALRRALVQFTGRPIKAVASGTLVTVLVQSSSATTVTVIGFVSAGLLTFPQAVGVVLGASLGTTGTGWIVPVLGLKFSLGLYALPLVGAGTFLRLLARNRGRAWGVALAGFGLIFIGIDTLQTGMQALSGVFHLAAFPSTGFLSHLLMMAVGVVLTVIMQSSSAAMATTLTALHTHSVNFEQASSLVIGASIGTTVTSALAAFGASISAKRTALAHVLFNLATGLIAVLLLPLFLWGIQESQQHLGLQAGAMSLAAFHTAFILVGVVIFLPFIGRFSQWIERLLPEKGPPLTRHLDDTVLNVPAVALEATRRALTETACELFNSVRTHLYDLWKYVDTAGYFQVQEAIEQTQLFLARIPPLAEGEPVSQSRVMQMHALDHLVRLQSHLRPPAILRPLMTHERLQPLLRRVREILELAELGLHGKAPADWSESLVQKSMELAELRRRERPDVFRQTASGSWDPTRALAVLDAMRWLDRVGYHTWRICNYLGARDADVLEISEEQLHLHE